MPKIDSITRRELLAGLGIAAGEILLLRSSVLASLLNPSLPTVVVSEPTGAAIQAAINKLGTGGGNIYLSARIPYVINQTLVIANNNINLIGRGPRVTRLLAQSGAILTVPYHAEEYLLLVQGAANATILGLTVDTANEANSPGNLRVGIGAWSSTSVLVSQAAFVKNLGPNAFNRALAFSQCSTVTADRCEVSQSRDGIFVWETTNFQITRCGIHDCEVLLPDFTGVVSPIDMIDSTTGLVSSCYVYRNTTPMGISLGGCAGVVIESCSVYKTLPYPTQPGNDGIYISNCTQGHSTVQNCSLLENSGAGVSAQQSSNVLIQGCTIENSGTPAAGGSGVSINGGTQNVEVMGNLVSDNRSLPYGGIVAGFSSSVDSGGKVSGNVVHGLAQGVALGSNSNDFQVQDNDLTLNTVCVLNDGTDNVISGNSCS